MTESSQLMNGKRRKHSKGGAYHWREYGIEELLPPPGNADRVLLLGCGDGGERPYLRGLGFEATGLDIRRSSGVDLIGDAHLLPVKDSSFDIVLSMQVLEHLHSPWIAVDEIARILRPGGWFVGSVAFLKPYHNSYFHMTHKGVQHLLDDAGLEVDTFHGAQSPGHALYGSMVPLGSRPFRRMVFGALERLLLWLRVTAWSLSRREDPDRPTDRFDSEMPLSFRTFDRLRYAAAVVFRARKVAANRGQASSVESTSWSRADVGSAGAIGRSARSHADHAS